MHTQHVRIIRVCMNKLRADKANTLISCSLIEVDTFSRFPIAIERKSVSRLEKFNEVLLNEIKISRKWNIN